MRIHATVLACLCLLPVAACVTQGGKEGPSTIIKVQDAAEQKPKLTLDEKTKLVRHTDESVNRYEELRVQGQTQAMSALRDAIATSVDQDYPIFEEMALKETMYLKRNMAVKCLGFARENKVAARDALLQVAEQRGAQPFLRANALLSIGSLRDPDTPLEPIIALLSSSDPGIKASAARAFKELALVKKTPRTLTKQYHTAVERLATMLYDKTNVDGRRAAVFAIANLRHPDTLDHLIAALNDKDETVQIGALWGIELLGDQRAIKPVIEFLKTGPTSSAESWSIQALKAIANQAGLTKDGAGLNELGSSPRKWEQWFRAARMQ